MFSDLFGTFNGDWQLISKNTEEEEAAYKCLYFVNRACKTRRVLFKSPITMSCVRLLGFGIPASSIRKKAKLTFLSFSSVDVTCKWNL